MNRLFFLMEKEFRQIFRNRAMLPILFAMPVIQMLILGKAATMEMRRITFAYTDSDRSPVSRDLIRSLTAGGYFYAAAELPDAETATTWMDEGRIKAWLHIPDGFGAKAGQLEPVQVQLTVDAVDGYTAGLVQNYAGRVLQAWNLQLMPVQPAGLPVIEERHWYNPELLFAWYMVPGILVVLVTMVATFLSAMNIVREREIGTMEQLNVTPIPKGVFIIGKLLPFWIIGLAELMIGLAAARLVYGVPLAGEPALLLFMTGLYLVGMLGLGLLISTFTDTQQQAMLIAWFILVVFILLGGLFTPIESMPEWARRITNANPVAWFIRFMRGVMLKGSTWRDALPTMAFLTGFAVLTLSAAVLRYRKTAG